MHPNGPSHRAVATQWKRCLVQVVESWANPLGNGDQMMWMVSSARPPNVSATRGMNSTPADRHPVRCDVSLRWTPTCMDQFSKDQSLILRVFTFEPLNEDGPVIKHKMNQYKSHTMDSQTHTHTHTHTSVQHVRHGWHCDMLFCLHCPHTELTWWSP